MYNPASPTTPISPPPPSPKKHRFGKKTFVIGTLAAGAAIGGIIAGTGSHTTIRTVSGPTVTVTRNVPVPGSTRIVTKTVKVPGPVRTVTVSVPAPPPAAGQSVGSWSGTGNQVTPAFTVPSSGDYIVRWSYSGNLDSSFGSSQPTNFNINNTGNGIGDLPNDIAASGRGSTEITGDSSGTESFNVQAVGSWTITVIAAS